MIDTLMLIKYPPRFEVLMSETLKITVFWNMMAWYHIPERGNLPNDPLIMEYEDYPVFKKAHLILFL
jgi:hypothetical protein